jgi:hypothetical protein
MKGHKDVPAEMRGTPAEEETSVANVDKRKSWMVLFKGKSWEFSCGYIGDQRFSDDRPKTLRAMQVLCERMPEEDKERIPDVVVFAPSPSELGAQIVWVERANRPIENRENLLYFSPAVERRPQSEVNAGVAHEFAHAILGHGGALPNDDPYRQEREADQLIEKWGYRPTNSCGWMRQEKTTGQRNLG